VSAANTHQHGTSEARSVRDDRGQAAVELAMAMPLVVVFVLGVLQVALVARDQLAVELAAREAARAASVSADPAGAATAAASRVTELGPLDVSVSVAGDVVRVRVSYTNPTDVAIVGAAIGDVTLDATATMAFDPPSP
jgi:Flp pilus assembly protein TadG